MDAEKKKIEEKISEILNDLDGAYIIPVDEDNIKNIRTSVVELLEDVIRYLGEMYTEMTPWQKEHVVEAINALYWDWLHRALSSARLSIADLSTISPDNKYKEEIFKLRYDDLVVNISKAKDCLTKDNLLN